MKKIVIEHTKGIKKLEFLLPEAQGVYLLVGTNGAGKTTLLTCMDRICNSLAFAQGFDSSTAVHEVDQFIDASIKYSTANDISVCFRKKSQRWVPTPKAGSAVLRQFGFSESIFVHADSKRIDVNQADLRAGDFIDAAPEIKQVLNYLLETEKYSNLMRLRNCNGRGRQATYFYVLKVSDRMYYSEKRFSTGELALLRLVEKLQDVQENAIVLLDEAEMALHPRVQVNLINYLQQKARERNITVFVSTHSPTMIKCISKENILMIIDDSGTGDMRVVTPCYPATAIGCVDFEAATIYDYIFFVEDDVARAILKRILNKYFTFVPTHATALTSIIPVGGFFETARMAVCTRHQVFAQSKVFAVVDEDAFEDIDQKPKFKDLYEHNRGIIFGFGFTPEVFLVKKLQARSMQLSNSVINDFHAKISEILLKQEYIACNAQNPRQLAKDRFSVIVQSLCEISGDSIPLVRDHLIQLIVDDMDREKIMTIMGPILRR